jgi:Rieske Fe-S protein
MKHAFRLALMATVIGSTAVSAMAADAPTQAQAKPTAVKPAASAAVPTKLPESGKPVTSGATIGGKNGDNQYPGVTIVPPRPPKKEALEAGALKAQGAVAK